MAEPVLFDPAIEDLLREIAADPDSCLLRVPRPSIVKSLAHRQGVVRPSATGLSSAERELLRVHRAELAKLLREACVLRLAQHPQLRLELSLHLTATRRTPVMSSADWRSKTKYTLQAARSDGSDLGGMELLDACVAPGGVESTSVAQLAIASMRLEPTDAARIYPAVELTLDGAERMALRILHETLLGLCSNSCAAHAWTHVAHAQAKTGEIAQANASYVNAVRQDPTLIVTFLAMLGMACEYGSLQEILAAEAQLDSRLTPTSSAATEFVGALRARRASGNFKLPRKRAELLTTFKDHVGITARMFIDAHL
jgi:hypothetical protein